MKVEMANKTRTQKRKIVNRQRERLYCFFKTRNNASLCKYCIKMKYKVAY